MEPRPENVTARYERSLKNAQNKTYVMRLYVTG